MGMEDELFEEEPEVVLLCNLASYKDSLSELCYVGGLEAISLISYYGVPSAILAMREVLKEDPSVILDIEGHVSVMDVLNTDSRETLCSNQDLDEKKKYRRTKVSFEFLTELCKSCEKGRKAVTEASSCPSCIHTAYEIICSCTQKEKLASENAQSDEKESKNDRDFDKEIIADALISKPKKKDDNLDMDQKMTTIAALSFLSEIKRAELSREIMLKNSNLIELLVHLGKESSDIDIAVHSTELLKSVTPFVGCGTLDEKFSSSFFATVFSNILSRSDFFKNNFPRKEAFLKWDNDNKISNKTNNNMMFALAAAGLEYVYDGFQSLDQRQIYDCLFRHLKRITEEYSKWAFSKKKHSGSIISKNSGMLAANIATLLLMWRCSSCKMDSYALIKTEFLSALLQLVIVHELVEKRIGKKKEKEGLNNSIVDIDDEMLFLTAARTQCLQFISGLLRINSCKDSFNFSWNNLNAEVKNRLEQIKMDSTTTHTIFQDDHEILESSCDFMDVLNSICHSKSDKLAVIYAVRIKERLGW